MSVKILTSRIKKEIKSRDIPIGIKIMWFFEYFWKKMFKREKSFLIHRLLEFYCADNNFEITNPEWIYKKASLEFNELKTDSFDFCLQIKNLNVRLKGGVGKFSNGDFYFDNYYYTSPSISILDMDGNITEYVDLRLSFKYLNYLRYIKYNNLNTNIDKLIGFITEDLESSIDRGISLCERRMESSEDFDENLVDA